VRSALGDAIPAGEFLDGRQQVATTVDRAERSHESPGQRASLPGLDGADEGTRTPNHLFTRHVLPIGNMDHERAGVSSPRSPVDSDITSCLCFMPKSMPTTVTSRTRTSYVVVAP
jgi:hypothetical protein